MNEWRVCNCALHLSCAACVWYRNQWQYNGLCWGVNGTLSQTIHNINLSSARVVKPEYKLLRALSIAPSAHAAAWVPCMSVRVRIHAFGQSERRVPPVPITIVTPKHVRIMQHLIIRLHNPSLVNVPFLRLEPRRDTWDTCPKIHVRQTMRKRAYARVTLRFGGLVHCWALFKRTHVYFYRFNHGLRLFMSWFSNPLYWF